MDLTKRGTSDKIVRRKGLGRSQRGQNLGSVE